MKFLLFLTFLLNLQTSLFAQSSQKYDCTIYEGATFEIGNTGLTTHQSLELDGDVILTDEGTIIEITSVQDNKVQLKIKPNPAAVSSEPPRPGDPENFSNETKLVKTADHTIASIDEKIIKAIFENNNLTIIAKCIKIP